MRGSAASAASSARLRHVDLQRRVQAVDVVGIELQVARESCRVRPRPASPACGSSVVISASSMRRLHHVLDAFGREIGGVGRAGLAARSECAVPAPREPASFRFSTSRMRTLAENSSPSEMVHSASVAPAASARFTTSCASSSR